MALFTDGPVTDAEDLLRYEASVGDVAAAEGVSLSGKIALAQNECGSAVADFLRQNLCYAPCVTEALLKRVVVDARLKRWVALRALWNVFRDAYTRQLNDRYAAKREEFSGLMVAAQGSYFANGVGLVNVAVPQASKPLLSAVAGSSAPGTYYVAVANVDAQGQEGAPGPISALTTLNAQDVQVTISGSVLWNLYAGVSADVLIRQNAVPISTSTAKVPAALVASGVPLPGGQSPDVIVRWQRRIRRG